MTNWSGTLTIENISTVVDKIKKLLDGKKYSFVAAYEGYRLKLELNQHQQLKSNYNENQVFFDKDASPPRFAGFTFNDTYGVWGLTTNTNDDKYDGKYENPYIVISHNEIKITHKAGSGALVHWLIQLE